MGQARNRGTFEQRIEQAREAFNADIEVKKQDIEQMDALEQRQRDGLQHWVDSQVLPEMDRRHGALSRVDFSQVPLAVTKKALDSITSEA